MTLKIAFYQPHLDIQGTGVSNFDYAYFNQKYLGNESLVIYDKNDERSHGLAIEKFKKEMPVIGIDGKEDMDNLSRMIDKEKPDFLYIQKCGYRNDGRFAGNVKNLIHCVGVVNEPHGYKYAYVSQWLSEHCSGNKIPFIPYMVNMPDLNEDLRLDFNISKEIVVVARYGGMYSWNIPFVNKVVREVVETRKDIVFLFANTPKFMVHERVIFIEPFADLHYKRKFINTADYFLHARFEGESFGAAIAEFSYCNKPIITYKKSKERNHLNQLNGHAYLYSYAFTLKKILKRLIKQPIAADWSMYKDHSPEAVMNKFNKIFLL
jgi:hypothetical protein